MAVEIFELELKAIVELDSELLKLANDFIFTEGPVWDPASQWLYFSDIPADTLFRYSEIYGVEVYRKPSNFSNGLAFDRQGMLIACEHRTRRITRGKKKIVEVVADHYQGKRLNSPNDLILASDGSIIFTDPLYGLRDGLGGPGEQELNFQGVYRVPAGASEPSLLVDDFKAPNGLALAPDETKLYVDDTIRRHIRVFEIEDDWTLSGGDVLLEIKGEEEGKPDGMKLDAQGNIFCTGPGGIWICAPDGVVLGRISIPEKTSNLAWGGEDFRTLYITASSSLYKIRCITSGA